MRQRTDQRDGQQNHSSNRRYFHEPDPQEDHGRVTQRHASRLEKANPNGVATQTGCGRDVADKDAGQIDEHRSPQQDRRAG